MSSLFEMAQDAAESGRIAKLKSLIDNINDATGGSMTWKGGLNKIQHYYHIYGQITPLKMFFETNEDNEFTKIILESVAINPRKKNDKEVSWAEKYSKTKQIDDTIRKDAACDFIKACQYSNNEYERLLFVFWGLMIMSVDDNMADERLSFICDFAKLTGISDDDLLDLIHIIRTIYYGEDEHYEYKSKEVPFHFEKLINKYSEYKV